MALGAFPRARGLATTRSKPARGHFRAACPLQLLALLVVKLLATALSNATVLSAVAFASFPCSLGPLLGNLLWPVAGRERPALGPLPNHRPTRCVAWQLCWPAVPGHRSPGPAVAV